MTSKGDIIKNNKFILRDNIGLIKEIIFRIEIETDVINNNIIITLNKYEDIIRKCLQNDFYNGIKR
jgi:hypothetical protein